MHVINLSLSYGFTDRTCQTCGRAAGDSRSWVFELVLNTLADASPEPYVIASAGNRKTGELAYPARFGTVIATGAVTSAGTLAGYSNWGQNDHAGQPHTSYFVLPGGDDTGSEYVAEYLPSGKTFAGTSFATAYATGVVANVLADQHARGGLDTQAQTLDDLRAAADAQLGPATTHGNGLMRLKVGP